MPKKSDLSNVLTPREQKFIGEIVKNGGKQTAAAMSAGYSPDNPNAAAVTASRLLRKPKISAAVARRMRQAEQAAGITRQQVIGIFAEIAQTSLADVLDKNGELDWKKARRMGKDHLIKSVTVTERHSKDGSYRVSRKYEGYSRLEAGSHLKEIFGLHKQAGRNPGEIALETFRTLRANPDYADLTDEQLAAYPAERYGVSVEELLASK